jgi:hypothetical protein
MCACVSACVAPAAGQCKDESGVLTGRFVRHLNRSKKILSLASIVDESTEATDVRRIRCYGRTVRRTSAELTNRHADHDVRTIALHHDNVTEDNQSADADSDALKK